MISNFSGGNVQGLFGKKLKNRKRKDRSSVLTVDMEACLNLKWYETIQNGAASQIRLKSLAHWVYYTGLWFVRAVN